MLFSNFSGKLFLKLVYILCVILDKIAHGNTFKNRKLDHFSDEVQNYLMEFGYLPKSDIETGNLRTEAQLTSAIKALQKFGNIPQTGVIDEKTRELLQKPRCGQPDNPAALDFSATNRVWSHNHRRKRYVIQGPKWPYTNLTWSLVNQTMTILDAGQVRRILTEALDVWSRGSRLTFQEMYSEEADIQVLFARRYHGDGYDFDGPGSVLAHAFYPSSGRGGDAHFDEEENWILTSDPNVRGTSLMDVAVHEFGHSLGLGHSSVQDAIMFPWYHGYQMHNELPEDDRIAIQQIYGSREKQWSHNPHRPPPTTSTTTTPPPPTTTTTRRPYYHSVNRYPDREAPPTERPKYPKNPYYKPYNPTKHNPYNPRIFTERPEHTHPRKPMYPRFHERDYPRYYPEKPRVTTERPTKHHKKDKPDTCNTSYDSITMIRGELFVFKDRYMWRIGEQGLYAGYPHEITRVWNALPDNFTHVDAVYENSDRKIVFFIGKMYYVFSSNILENGYPKPITELGLPILLNKIDSALVWGHNNRTYFYSGTMYWRFDEEIKHVELDYPRDMSIWRGIGYHIDAAFQWKDGKSYFFKGTGFWKFDDSIMRVAHNRPKVSAIHWMGCPRTHYDIEDVSTQKAPLTSSSNSQSIHHHWPVNFLLVSCSFVFVVFKLQ